MNIIKSIIEIICSRNQPEKLLKSEVGNYPEHYALVSSNYRDSYADCRCGWYSGKFLRRSDAQKRADVHNAKYKKQMLELDDLAAVPESG